jgi:alpha-L-rhamnosidase
MQFAKLTCEQLENPLAIDTPHPRFGWIFHSDAKERGKMQSAYHVLVASGEDKLQGNTGDLWDSGKVTSDQSAYIEYSGQPLKSRGQYYWKVRIWDETGTDLGWTPVATFTMGIFPEDWKGEWIGELTSVSLEDRFPVTKDLEDCPDWIRAAARREHPKGPGPENDYAYAVHLRKEFTAQSNVKRAILRIIGLGYHEVYLNGRKIGDHVLDPGATDYTKTVLYVSHDVTTLMNEGENCIGVLLGNGWYWVGTPDLFGFEKAEWAAPPKCRLELEIIALDGKSTFICSDGSWQCTGQGPIRFNCVRSGEIYDANHELGPWSQVNGIKGHEKAWKNALIVPAPTGIPRPQLGPAITIRDKFAPCRRELLSDGHLVYWFPKNNAGWVEIAVRGKPGQRILIECNERLQVNGHVDMHINSGHTYGRFQTCEYICKGDGSIERYHPRFCYMGFQYAELSGVEPDQIVDIVAHQVCTDFFPAGDFRSSDLLLNAINEAAKLTFLNGFHSYPEDCPQREKAGWTEDALLSAHGSIYNFNALHAYKKWIQDLMDAQHTPSGQVPDIVPTPFWGKPSKVATGPQIGNWTTEYVGNMADPWWGGVLVMLPWRLYLHYGDKRLLGETYPAMKAYVEFLLRTTEIEPGEYSYLINWNTLLGDWLEVGSAGSATRTPRILTCTQAFYRCTEILAKAAKILALDADSARYMEIQTKIAEAFNEEFLDRKTGLYCPDSQSAPAMALVLGMNPVDMTEKIFQGLVANVVEKHGGHFTTGIVGTYFLYHALAEGGRPDLVYRILTATGFPSFEHNLTRSDARTPLPSTTLWEDWGGISSLAHPVQGTVVSVFYEYIMGIKPLAESVGFKKVCIAPQFSAGITSHLHWVKATYQTIYGPITLHWERKVKESPIIAVILSLPPNIQAEVELPVTEDQIHFPDNIQISTNSIHGKNKTRMSLGSGNYEFSFPCP